MDGVKVALGSRGWRLYGGGYNQAKIGRSGKPWCIIIYLIEFHAAILALFLCSFGHPSPAPLAYHLQRIGCRYMMRFVKTSERGQLLISINIANIFSNNR